MIEVRLLGIPRITLGEQELYLPYQKATALLAYLAVSGKAHNRRKLASLLWGDVNDNRAQNSLRNALFVIRRETAPAELLHTRRDLVSLAHFDDDETKGLWLDTAVFQTAIQQKTSISALQETLDIWQGTFLEGLNVDGAPEFEHWLAATRAQFQRLYQDGWMALSRALSTAGQLDEAIEAAQRLLTLDPLREVSHRQLMRLYLKRGNRSAALQQYEQCRALLAEELGIIPDTRTQALHTQALAETTPIYLTGEVTAVSPIHALVPFVGRRRELADLNQHWRAARQLQHGRLVLITGEAGVGKTRLAQEWTTHVRHAYILHGRCFAAEHSIPYHPWIDILRASLTQIDWEQLNLPDLWLAELARLLPELRVQRPDLVVPATPDPRLIRGRLAEAIRQWLLAISRQRPVCLFLDDLQWIDRASMALLEYVLRQSAGLPLLILGVQREAEAEADWQQMQRLLAREKLSYRLELYRFGFPDVAQMAQNVGFESADPDTFLKRLFRETEGNPLFILEICRTLQRLDGDPAGEWPIPSTIQGVIRSRLDRVRPETRRLLAVAAVIGRLFDYDTLQAVTGQPPGTIWAALEEGLAADLVQEKSGQYDFTHDKIRAVLTADLGEPRLRHLHGRIATTLEMHHAGNLMPIFGLLAHHYAVAGQFQRARAYTLQTARRAAELYADEDALTEYARILQWSEIEGLADDLPAETAVDIIPFYTPGSSPRNTVGVSTLAYTQRGLIFQRTGRYAQAEQSFRQALDRARARGRLDEETAVHNYLSFLNYLQCNYEGVAQHARLAVDLARQIGHPQLLATGLKNQGIVAYQAGEYARALELYNEALAIYETISDRMGMGACHNNIGYVQDAQGEYEAAVASYKEALRLRRELGQIEGQAVHLANIGRVYGHQGNVEQATHYLNQAYKLGQEINATWVLTKAHRTLAMVAILSSDWETALNHAQTALTLADELDNKEDQGGVLPLLGDIAAHWPESALGDPTNYFERGIVLLEEVGEQSELIRARERYAHWLQSKNP
ncbi:MAG: AAA family ATPase [Anaerolineales bacterium]|nr:AAA family ATPase [Anaerolineales bacterium]MCB9004076.1 AAA family ATPase [Ardenticatenaceae bacterium]